MICVPISFQYALVFRLTGFIALLIFILFSTRTTYRTTKLDCMMKKHNISFKMSRELNSHGTNGLRRRLEVQIQQSISSGRKVVASK